MEDLNGAMVFFNTIENQNLSTYRITKNTSTTTLEIQEEKELILKLIIGKGTATFSDFKLTEGESVTTVINSGDTTGINISHSLNGSNQQTITFPFSGKGLARRSSTEYDYLSDKGIVRVLEETGEGTTLTEALRVKDTPEIIPFNSNQQTAYNKIKQLKILKGTNKYKAEANGTDPVAYLSVQYEKANEEVEGLKKEIDTIKSEQTTQNNDISSLQENDTTQDSAIQELETTVEGLHNYDDTDIKEDITNLKNEDTKINKALMELEDKAGNKLSLEVDSKTYILTLKLLNSKEEQLDLKTIDLPLETMVVNGRFESNKIILVLDNGNEIEVPVGALIDGLVGQETFDETVENINKEVQEIKTRLDTIEKEQSTQNEDIEELKGTSKTNTEEIEKIKKEIATRGHVYTAIYDTSTSTPTLERADDAVGMVANATKNGEAVENDFDNVWPWAGIKPFNLDTSTGDIKAWLGDPDFALDGSNGEVYVRIPTFWVRVWKIDETHIGYSIADYAKSGYTEVKEFSIMKYLANYGTDGNLHSYSGLLVAGEKSIVTYRNIVKEKLGSGYCLMDWRYFAIQVLYLVEYATFNSQSALGNGMVNLRVTDNDKALIAEESTNRIVINTASGNSFVIGQRISIGKTANGQYNVARDRVITAINDYSEGDVAGKEIVFDGDPVAIEVNNIVWSSPQLTGGSDNLKSPSGVMNNNGRYSVAYRYIEDIFGHVYQWLDSINIQDRQAYVCYDPEQYVSDVFKKPYTKLGYKDAEAESGYIKELGYDEAHPLIAFPTKTNETGTSSTTYMCDYNWNSVGNRSVRVGGHLNGGALAGLWSWTLSYPSGTANWSCGCRVLKYQ